MSEQLENNPANRFVAFCWAVGLIFCFGILLLIVASGAMLTGDDDVYDEERAADRSAKLAAVKEEQAKLLAGAGEAVEGGAGKIRIPLEVAGKVMIKVFKEVPPKASTVPVPGSPAAVELMKAQAAQAEEAAPPTGAASPPQAAGAPGQAEGEAKQVAPKAEPEAKKPGPAVPKAGPEAPKNDGPANPPAEGAKQGGEVKAGEKAKAQAEAPGD